MDESKINLASILASKPTNLHKGSKGAKAESGDDLDISDMIDKSGCADVYYTLEECLGEYDRDWRKCQKEVQLLKICSLRMNELRRSKAP